MRSLALLLCAAPLLAGGYEPAKGPHAVGSVATITLGEEKLEVRATFPKDRGTHPVLVFSHGMFGSKDGYQPLATYWAAHGYVVFQPTHGDSLTKGVRSRQEAQRAWNQRPREISFLLDSLDVLGSKVPGKLDRKRIGVGGHSFGAHTSQLIGGVTARGKSFADARAKCVLLLSPQGKSALFSEASWKTLTRPALVITGSKDSSPLSGRPPEWRLDPFKYSPPGDRYLVWIDGAHHGFGDISGARGPGAGPKNAEHVRIVRQATLAFWDAFVKDDAAARAWLRAGALESDAVRCENRLPPKKTTGSSAPGDRPSRRR